MHGQMQCTFQLDKAHVVCNALPVESWRASVMTHCECYIHVCVEGSLAQARYLAFGCVMWKCFNVLHSVLHRYLCYPLDHIPVL